eukprot:TRINITY_DN17140_c0_g2_i1.p1 TRINITY_DN17140_c0_g2~~TRINITY_DN17140_c0_g2_i1.p1  ORF type:complete len:197 (+),score=-19.02 TRINITY_DN17140_c0_g2_i1:753-1343(+)
MFCRSLQQYKKYYIWKKKSIQYRQIHINIYNVLQIFIIVQCKLRFRGFQNGNVQKKKHLKYFELQLDIICLLFVLVNLNPKYKLQFKITNLDQTRQFGKNGFCQIHLTLLHILQRNSSVRGLLDWNFKTLQTCICILKLRKISILIWKYKLQFIEFKIYTIYYTFEFKSQKRFQTSFQQIPSTNCPKNIVQKECYI